ncbi:hypothetical protein [Burkholderia vietnamiensis]|uniref:hypothetical protein n=1 Tax=Burkholderia vietnamiensis TaxID=60552 RepID=UPI00159321C1|nr:hypothetical protein [Burkholderia vietnamiensis]
MSTKRKQQGDMLNRTTIRLQTAAGRDISNFQEHEVDASEYQKLDLHRRKYPDAIQRNNPVSLYNCHGLVFASRRAWVHGDDLSNVLQDDGYIEVRFEDVLPGDIVIYFIDGKPEHTGTVTSVLGDGALRSIDVCSKWGHGAEYVHHVAKSPYGAIFRFFRI